LRITVSLGETAVTVRCKPLPANVARSRGIATKDSIPKIYTIAPATTGISWVSTCRCDNQERAALWRTAPRAEAGETASINELRYHHYSI